MIYDTLNYTLGVGTFTYTECRIAGWVFKTYIQTNPYLYKTWKWIMGLALGNLRLSSSSTLVDVVNLLWKAGTNAIQAVKDAATNFVQGIKAAGQFIANAVIDSIMQLFTSVIISFLHTIAFVMNSFSPLDKQINILNDGIQIDTNAVKIDYISKSLIITTPYFILNIKNFLSNGKTSLNSLSLNTDPVKIADIAGKFLIFLSLTQTQTSPVAFGILMALGLGALIGGDIIPTFQVLNNSNINVSDKQAFVNDMSGFHFASMIGELLPLAIEASGKLFNFAFPQFSKFKFVATSLESVSHLELVSPQIITGLISSFLTGVSSFFISEDLTNILFESPHRILNTVGFITGILEFWITRLLNSLTKEFNTLLEICLVIYHLSMELQINRFNI